ncbi:MAG: hypothetical protein MJ210_04185 [Alphaproteobacteria bacterium]|nr:hypothetical protein [Alphaproteobacteria bacterium]
MAPYVLNSNVAEYLKAKEVEVFGSELRALELPTMSDLTNWSKFDRFVSQTLYTAESGKGRCENGLYFSREGKCVKIRHGKVTSYFTEDTCRVLPVIPLCEEDFIGRLSGGEAVVQKIIDELFKLKSV